LRIGSDLGTLSIGHLQFAKVKVTGITTATTHTSRESGSGPLEGHVSSSALDTAVVHPVQTAPLGSLLAGQLH
jgi:hypothetical protein